MMNILCGCWILLAVLSGTALQVAAATVNSTSVTSSAASGAPAVIPVHDSRFIVIWKNAAAKNKATVSQALQVRNERPLRQLSAVGIYEKRSSQSLKDAMLAMQSVDGVVAVYPDHHIEPFQVPNDPSYEQQWSLSQTSDVDINAPIAWDVTTGQASVYVGVIDTGVDVSHEDLAANIWTNPGEIAANGIDDDGNGWIDDVHGIDTLNYDATPEDDVGHGTHVAGTIAAAGNNGVGVTGVSWSTGIIPCKFMDEYGGYDSGAIACLDYLLALKVDKGIDIIATNNSWGSYSFSQPLYDAIQAHADNGILFVAAAGNDAVNNNVYPSYPASYANSNIIAVASHGRDGQLSYFSNYGAGVVDIAAPGDDILSTVPNNSYDYYSGTSMAAPHVAGSVALLRAAYPDSTALGLRSLLLNAGIDRSTFASKTDYGRLRLVENDGSGAIACESHNEYGLLEPVEYSTLVPIGNSVRVRYSSSRCGAVGDPVVLTASNGDSIYLQDNGIDADADAGDGIYSGYIEVNWSGERHFEPVGGTSNDAFVLVGVTQPVMSQVSYRYETLSDTTVLDLSDDSVGDVVLPFTLQSPNGDITELHVSSNGVVFGASGYSADYNNQELPFSNSEQMYAVFWSDLTPDSGSVYRYGVVGEAPNRKLVVEYSNVYFYGVYNGDAAVTFQVVFSESSPVVYYNYQDVTVDSFRSLGASAAVGYQHDGYGQTWSRNTASLSDGLSLMVALPGNSDSTPQITSLDITGIARVGYPQTITVTVPADNPDGTLIEVDAGDGEGYRTYNADTGLTVIYDEAELYTLTGRVTYNEAYSTVTTTRSILTLSELEQALIDEAVGSAVDTILAAPDEYGLVSQAEAEASEAAAVSSAIDGVVASPGDYGLVSAETAQAELEAAVDAARHAILDDPQSEGLTTIVTTADDINALALGVHLLGASVDITDLDTFFGGVKFVWAYENGVFKGWSSDADRLTRLQNSGYGVLTSISAGQGFWVNK